MTIDDSALDTRETMFDLGLKSLIFAIVVVLGCTTFPYDFTPSGLKAFSNPEFLAFVFLVWDKWLDLFANLLMFTPIGFALCAVLWSAGKSRSLLIQVTWVCAALSVTIEIMQLFLPTRHVSAADVVSNTVGGLTGCWLFLRHGHHCMAAFRRLKSWLSGTLVTKLWVGYFVLLTIAAFWLRERMELTSWETSYALYLGNEATTDRPWRGEFKRVLILNRAVSRDDVARIMSGDDSWLQDSKDYVVDVKFDSLRPSRVSGKLPSLIQGRDSSSREALAAASPPNTWWATADAAADLSVAVKERGELTVVVVAATADPSQKGPARIVSLSKDAKHRNFTLGQDGPDIVFRLRTGIAGPNGTYPSLYAKDVLPDRAIHTIVATYDGQTQTIYVDSPDQTAALEYDLGLAFSSLFRDIPFREHLIHKVWFYWLAFLPLTCLAALGLRRGTLPRSRRIGTAAAVSLMSPSLLEVVLSAGATHYDFSVSSAIVASSSMVGTFLVFWLPLGRFTRLN